MNEAITKRKNILLRRLPQANTSRWNYLYSSFQHIYIYKST